MSSNCRFRLVTLVVIAALSIISAQPSAAQTPSNPRSMIKLRTEGQRSPPATLKDVDWVQGHWVGQMPDGPVEKISLTPMFGHLPVFVRAVTPTNVIFYEIAVFAEVGNSLTVRVKHFTPDLEGWEAREAYIDRPLIAREGETLYFDGITYSRTGSDTYTVYFLNRSGGEERDTLVIPFRRVATDRQLSESD